MTTYRPLSEIVDATKPPSVKSLLITLNKSREGAAWGWQCRIHIATVGNLIKKLERLEELERLSRLDALLREHYK